MDVNKGISKIALPGVQNIIAVASGKGGVGKSTVSAGLALALARDGYKVGIMDADIYGPSIPLLTGTQGFKPMTLELGGGTTPQITTAEKYGIKIQSIGYFISDKAALWRGPMASNTLMQLVEQSAWCRLDYLIIDLPPGTGDIQLSIFQRMTLSGAIVVTTPQTISVTDASKAAEMIRNDAYTIPLLGVVENMSWFSPAPHPDERYYLFGQGGGQRLADQYGVPLLAQIPLVMENDTANATDHFIDFGHSCMLPYFEKLAKAVTK